jgi:hypothetical protein
MTCEEDRVPIGVTGGLLYNSGSGVKTDCALNGSWGIDSVASGAFSDGKVSGATKMAFPHVALFLSRTMVAAFRVKNSATTMTTRTTAMAMPAVVALDSAVFFWAALEAVADAAGDDADELDVNELGVG